MWTIAGCIHLGRVVLGLAADVLTFLRRTLRSRAALAAENLFLRKQLALYGERQVKPRRASDRMRLALVLLTHCFA
jgi:putative transposase